VAAALGLPGSNPLVVQGLGPQNFNPTTYTAADCPTYVGQSGPNCPAGATAANRASATSATSATSVATTPAQVRSATKIAAGLNRGRQPTSAAVTALLLEPLLVHLSAASS
jgi:hypothetical protein